MIPVSRYKAALSGLVCVVLATPAIVFAMARKKARKQLSVKKERIPPYGLDHVGLTLNQKIRYKENDKEGASWYIAKAKHINMDGSVAAIDLTTGNWRSLHAEKLEIESVGPRGGRTWVSLISDK